MNSLPETKLPAILQYLMVNAGDQPMEELAKNIGNAMHAQLVPVHALWVVACAYELGRKHGLRQAIALLDEDHAERKEQNQ